MDSGEMKRRTKQFAVDVVMFARGLPGTDEARVMRRQLIRSCTSVGANYRSACLARSQADFVSKLGIAIEEADESHYWMEVLVDTGNCRMESVAALLREASELTSILIASVKTAGPRKPPNNQ